MQDRFSLPLLPSLCLFLTLASACAHNAPFPQPMAVDVPAGLGQQQVEAKMLAGLLNRPTPYYYDAEKSLAPAEFDKFINDYFIATPNPRGWVVEKRKPGLITAVLSRPGRYTLRIHARYDQSVVQLSIVDSTGLNQTDTQIHRNAVGWLLKAQRRIHAQYYPPEIQ